MKYTVLLLLPFLVFSCSRNHVTPVTTSLIIGDPVSYDSSDILLFPVGVITKQEKKSYTGSGKDDEYGKRVTFFENSSERRNEYYSIGDVRNMIFYNKFSKEYYRLLNEDLRISRFIIHYEFNPDLIFYEMIKSDFNGDSSMTTADGITLFVSNKDGKNFKQISPDNEQFLVYNYYPETQSLLIKSRQDSDHDKQFTNVDEYRFTEVDLNNPGIGRDLFSSDFTAEMKKMVQK